jgi:hypothetical protein
VADCLLTAHVRLTGPCRPPGVGKGNGLLLDDRVEILFLNEVLGSNALRAKLAAADPPANRLRIAPHSSGSLRNR